ncbi:hypothetical protein [Vibrio sp. R78045]|uniref:hypothetical protein n=1 Tax=Vibrio sp. R78045 TaxID=3093868 RepID=UPI0036F2DDE1
MMGKLTRFIEWLYSDEESSKTRNDTAKNKPGSDELPQSIKDAIRVLKRSGLALPFEVWEEFVVDVVRDFYKKHPEKTGALLMTATYAVRIRRNFLLPPACEPEDRVHREIVWVYGVFVTLVLHYAGLSFLQLSQLFSEEPQKAITADKDLCSIIDETLKNLNSDNVFADIVRQALAAQAANVEGATKEEINAAAEAARFQAQDCAHDEVINAAKAPVSDSKAEFYLDGELGVEDNKGTYEAARAFLEWSLLPVSESIQVFEDGSTFYALPAFAEFAEVTQTDKATLIAEFEALTGLEPVRAKLKNGNRHKGYHKC